MLLYVTLCGSKYILDYMSFNVALCYCMWFCVVLCVVCVRCLSMLSTHQPSCHSADDLKCFFNEQSRQLNHRETAVLKRIL